MSEVSSCLPRHAGRPLAIVAAAFVLLLAATMALWVHYGTAVFYEMILAGLALLSLASVSFFSGRQLAGLVLPLTLGAVMIVIGFQAFLIALLADIVAINRTLLEELKLREARKILRALPTDGTEVSEQERISRRSQKAPLD